MKPGKKSPPKTVWIVSGCITLLLLGGGIFMVKLIMSDLGPMKKIQISTVNLLPPPPPVVKEKPPEPEPQVKKEIKEQVIDTGPDSRPNDANKPDEKPVGKQLGLDAEGTAGSDTFGLVGNKGGAGLIGGGGGGGGGTPFGRYGRLLEDDLSRKVKKRLEANGGIPKGKLQLMVQIDVDSRGRITKFRIVSSSGDARLDSAVRETLKHDGIMSQAPPEGMPGGVNIRISSQG
jgi:TonB family protein